MYLKFLRLLSNLVIFLSSANYIMLSLTTCPKQEFMNHYIDPPVCCLTLCQNISTLIMLLLSGTTFLGTVLCSAVNHPSYHILASSLHCLFSAFVMFLCLFVCFYFVWSPSNLLLLQLQSLPGLLAQWFK